MLYKIIVDKQSRINPSQDKREYEIDIEELRVKGDVYDSLVITKDEDYVMRRLSLSNLHVLSVLDKPVKETLTGINIELFEGDNYIYLIDMVGNKFYAEYIVKNEFNDIYATKKEMNTAINQTADAIELIANQKLDKDKFSTQLVIDYESVQIAWNKISEFIQFINAQLQIKGENKKLLMSLDKLGQHFYKSSGEEIGDIGLIDGNKIAFAIQNGQGLMAWGIKYTDEASDKEAFYPVFSYDGKMEVGTGDSDYRFSGFFDFNAPIRLYENKIYFDTEDKAYLEGGVLGNARIVLAPKVDSLGFSIEDNQGTEYFNINKESALIKCNNTFAIQSHLTGKFLLKMYKNQDYDAYIFNFNNNSIVDLDYLFAKRVKADNVPNSDSIYSIDGTANSNISAYFKDGGSVSIYTSSSDRRLKRKIEDSRINALDKILKIRHRSFEWKKDNVYVDNGYIAQEMEEIDKNYIHKGKIRKKDGTVDYDYQINILKVLEDSTKAIQELAEQNEQLKSRIEKLEAKN